HALGQPSADESLRRDCLDRISRQARNLTRMVEDLLEASRVVHGKVSLRPERVDLARLARTVAEDRRPLLEGRGLTLATETPETPVWGRGDSPRPHYTLQ